MNKVYINIVKFAFLMTMAAIISPASADEKNSHPCGDSSMAKDNRDVCKNYILGFLEGALITDTAIIESLEDEPSGFMKRVYKRRSYYLKDSPPATFLARFCLPAPLEKTIVVNNIFNDFLKQRKNERDIDKDIYDVFKRKYPCE